MRQQARQPNQYLDLYYFESPQEVSQEILEAAWPAQKVCNDFWAKMVRRNFLVSPWFLVKPVEYWNRKLPGGAVHHLPMPLEVTGSLDIHGWIEKAQVNMPFLPEEDEQAKTWLRCQGWQEGEPFVCLQVRDGSYKGTQGLQGQISARNSDIANYDIAARWLAEQGVWVLRMGKNMAKPMPTSHPRIIDYAFHPERSDFLDIWLFAHCDFCISTGSGPDIVSSVYRRPLLILNYTMPEVPYLWSNAMHLLKPLVWKASGTPLAFREYLEHNWWSQGRDSTYYDRAGIQLLELPPEQILTAVQEQWQRMQGIWVDTEADRDRHHCFWQILKHHPNFIKSTTGMTWMHPECRASTTWLRSMGDIFLT